MKATRTICGLVATLTAHWFGLCTHWGRAVYRLVLISRVQSWHNETLPTPWEWDLKRLAASFVIAGRSNRFSSADDRVDDVLDVSPLRPST